MTDKVYYQINKIDAFCPEDQRLIRIINIVDNKERAEKIKKMYMSNRTKDEKKDRIVYKIITLKKEKINNAFCEFYKQGLLTETIEKDLIYKYGEKQGKSMAFSLIHELRKIDLPYEGTLDHWSLNNVKIEEKFNEHISTNMHICCRSNNLSCEVDLNGTIVKFNCIVFLEAFRV